MGIVRACKDGSGTSRMSIASPLLVFHEVARHLDGDEAGTAAVQHCRGTREDHRPREEGAMPRYTAIVTLMAVLLYFFIATRVAAARQKFNVPLPASGGHPDFDRVFRVHMNMLEWMPIFLP